jgi:hypothetical protein
MLQNTEAYGAHTLGSLSHRITHFFVSRFMFSHVYKIGFAIGLVFTLEMLHMGGGLNTITYIRSRIFGSLFYVTRHRSIWGTHIRIIVAPDNTFFRVEIHVFACIQNRICKTIQSSPILAHCIRWWLSPIGAS